MRENLIGLLARVDIAGIPEIGKDERMDQHIEKQHQRAVLRAKAEKKRKSAQRKHKNGDEKHDRRNRNASKA